MNLPKLEEQLIKHEGLVLQMYKDSVGVLTIGVGRNLEHTGLRNEAEAKFLLRSDLVAIRAELERAIPWINDLSEERQHVLMDMAFNLGVTGLMNFKKTLRHIADGEYAAASVEMQRSRWSRQVGQRSVTLSEMMAQG
jgi:lysozyme